MAASALYVALPGALHAGSTEPPAATGTRAISEADQEFLHEAMKTGNTEIMAAQLAQQKSQDPQVREYAERMIEEHRMNGDKLRQVAREMGYMLPPQVDQLADEEALKPLQEANGEDFDEVYAEAQVEAHEDAIDLYEEHVEEADSDVLRQYAKETLPHLEQHLAMAEKLPPLQ
jgi:putative membrane protein